MDVRLSATLTFADGMLYMVSDRGEVALVRPSPKRLEIVSRFRLPKGGKGDPWARPVVCGGRLHLRHGEFLYVYDVARGPDRAERAGERSAAREGVDGPPASGPLQ